MKKVIGTDAGGELTWKPEPFWATISDEGVVPHPDPANPKSRVFLATHIERIVLSRHAKYFAADNFHYAAWEAGIGRIATKCSLITEENDDNIYCIGYWKGSSFLFGKLLRTSRIYKRCARAFAEFAT